MKYFGTVKSFDATKGIGEIKPETSGDLLHFERSAFSWENGSLPTVGQRLSYDMGTTRERQPCALNLATI